MKKILTRLSFSYFTTLALACLFAGCSSYREQTQEKMAKAEQAKKTVVYVDMVADMFHPGHVAFLKKAKEQGDYLIVGLVSDADAASYKREPIMTLAERAIMVKSCCYVDEVIEACPLAITNELIDEKRVDLVVHGDDFNPEAIKTFYQAAIDRGIFKTVPYTPGISTSEIIKRLASRGLEASEKKMKTDNLTTVLP